MFNLKNNLHYLNFDINIEEDDNEDEGNDYETIQIFI